MEFNNAIMYLEETNFSIGIKDIEPTSLTDACFNFTLSKRALGLRTLFQQNPSLFIDCKYFLHIYQLVSE